MPDTVSPYDDEVKDPYEGDDVKNPHDDAEPAVTEEAAPDAAPRKTRRATKSTRATKKT